ncbi:MAG: hypothetical protein LBQ66_16245 [Planctomycetaceae bacterium]|nr:hypothetical protein [Planctomycetaceae bacterium]
MANVREATDRRAVTSPVNHYRSPTTGSPKRIGKTNSPYVLGVLVLPIRVPPPLFSSCFARRKRNRPAVGCPPYVLRHVLAFLPNLFGFLMHRGGHPACSSPLSRDYQKTINKFIDA